MFSNNMMLAQLLQDMQVRTLQNRNSRADGAETQPGCDGRERGGHVDSACFGIWNCIGVLPSFVFVATCPAKLYIFAFDCRIEIQSLERAIPTAVAAKGKEASFVPVFPSRPRSRGSIEGNFDGRGEEGARRRERGGSASPARSAVGGRLGVDFPSRSTNTEGLVPRRSQTPDASGCERGRMKSHGLLRCTLAKPRQATLGGDSYLGYAARRDGRGRGHIFFEGCGTLLGWVFAGRTPPADPDPLAGRPGSQSQPRFLA